MYFEIKLKDKEKLELCILPVKHAVRYYKCGPIKLKIFEIWSLYDYGENQKIIHMIVIFALSVQKFQ